jgi:acyl carrier protein
MSDREQVAQAVYGILVAQWPGRFRADQLADDVSLGGEGLGLDSIEIVELLLECDERLPASGASRRAEEILDEGPITIGRVIDRISSPGGERTPSR